VDPLIGRVRVVVVADPISGGPVRFPVAHWRVVQIADIKRLVLVLRSLVDRLPYLQQRIVLLPVGEDVIAVEPRVKATEVAVRIHLPETDGLLEVGIGCEITVPRPHRLPRSGHTASPSVHPPDDGSERSVHRVSVHLDLLHAHFRQALKVFRFHSRRLRRPNTRNGGSGDLTTIELLIPHPRPRRCRSPGQGGPCPHSTRPEPKLVAGGSRPQLDGEEHVFVPGCSRS